MPRASKRAPTWYVCRLASIIPFGPARSQTWSIKAVLRGIWLIPTLLEEDVRIEIWLKLPYFCSSVQNEDTVIGDNSWMHCRAKKSWGLFSHEPLLFRSEIGCSRCKINILDRTLATIFFRGINPNLNSFVELKKSNILKFSILKWFFFVILNLDSKDDKFYGKSLHKPDKISCCGFFATLRKSFFLHMICWFLSNLIIALN